MHPLEKQIAFIKEAEGLKSVVREAWTSSGRRESTAEHSWRLALMAGLLASSFDVDVGKTLLMCLIHDLGERYMGDISAASNPDQDEKRLLEERDVGRMLSLLPKAQEEALLALWREYNGSSTAEARLVKALDKAETILQHNQGENPPDFDYEFNLHYGKAYFQGNPLLLRLREMLDTETAAHAAQAMCPEKRGVIRRAEKKDASRLAEILIFSKRAAYRSIFQNDAVSFQEMRVLDTALYYRDAPDALYDVYVYDDGVVKGMMRWDRGDSGQRQRQLKELYVDPFFQRQGIGGAFISSFTANAEQAGMKSVFLWVLEENKNARAFYEKFGFAPNGEKEPQPGTQKYLLKYVKNI